MLSFLPSFMRGIIALLLLSFNIFSWSLLLLPLACIKLILPGDNIKHKLSQLLILCATGWIYCNSFLLKIVHKINWDAQRIESITPLNSYLLICNHRSWADIFVLQHIFKGRAPFMKFFLKRELIWLPIMGFLWWAMDYPFMKRYSKSFLQKHPHLRGKDMEMTRKFCGKLKKSPVTIVNFLEGTRFNFEKHKTQESPYPHLLRPKAGGIAVAISTMGNYLSKALDVTIVYPENKPPVGFWQLLKGDVTSIIVRMNTLNVPENFLGANYQENTAFRKNMQQWVNQVWSTKNKLIEDILEEYPALPDKKTADNHITV